MADKLKVVARLGTSVQSVVLINGEMGYQIDKKVFLVGDDTTQAPKIATSKSIGEIEYLPTYTPTYGNIKIHEGGKVDGVELAGMRKLRGVPVHLGEGKFRSKTLKGDGEFIEVSDPINPESDEIIITLDEAFKNQVGNGLVFSSGPDFPDDPRPGHVHFDEQKELIYVRVRTQDNNNFWLDIGSGGGGGGGSHIFFSATEPEQAGIGDQWVDITSKKLYLRMQEEDTLLWIERLI